MPPKLDPTSVVTVFVRVRGGEKGAVGKLTPKVGCLGISPKKVAEQIRLLTEDWKGITVTCRLTIQNKNCKIDIIPNSHSLIMKALKDKKDSNLSIGDIVEIAKVMREKSLAKTLAGTVTEILGTAVCTKCTVDGKSPKEIQKQIWESKIKISEKGEVTVNNVQ